MYDDDVMKPNRYHHHYESLCWPSDTFFSLDAPEGQKPGMPINVTVDAVSGGWVIRWKNPAVMPLYYTIEKKEDSQSAEWEPLTDHKIDPEEASYLSQYWDSFYIKFWKFSRKVGEVN